MKKTFILLLLSVCVRYAAAQEIDSLQLMLDSIEARFDYQTGSIALSNGIGTLNTPKGFRYINPEQAEFVIKDLWGNPEGSGTLGMIVPEDKKITDGSSWAFIITYDEMGYVKDDDASDIDYDELLSEIQKDTESANEERVKQGYEAISLVGWASKPFYDEDKKVLHWAKELKFGESDVNTLNYNVRILGRKGVLVLNAVAGMDQLAEVQQHIEPVLSSFEYADGNKYSDFDPGIDEVAAWTIGGLVAGKVLAKAGIFALLLKNIKLVGLAIAAAVGGLWSWFKKKTAPPTVRNISDSDPS